MILPFVVLSAIVYMYYSEDTAVTVTVKPLHPLTTNRTQPSSPVVDPSVVIPMMPLLEPHLQTHYIVCMHHLAEVTHPLQFCAVNKFYMMNPRIIGGSVKKKMYQQQSVCWNQTLISELHDEVFVQWDHREIGNTLYLLFQGNESIAIQLAIDEFACQSANVPTITTKEKAAGTLEYIEP